MGDRRIPDFYDLTRKEAAFLNAYFGANMSITGAAKRAGYKGTDFVLYQIGRDVLSRNKVRAAIQDIFSECTIQREEILYRLTEQARGAWADYIDPSGAVDVRRMVDDGKGYLIQSIEPNSQPNRPPRIRFADSQRAFEMIGRAYGMFTDKIKTDSEVVLKVQYGSDGSGDDASNT